MPLIVDVTDAVVAELNATTFSQPLTAIRSFLPRRDLADLKTLQVSVVPRQLTLQAVSRGQTQREIAIDVAVQKKLPQEANATLDPLLALAEEIAEHFQGKRLDSFPDAVWVKTEFQPIYAPEHIEQLRTFTSVITFTFRVIQ